ncbi:methyl-accepting chemotaxis sensory transducer, putative [Babesia caballi]|uniref:Methyl-accepting chemotaxis sensory transducer, putative n=1 Tax=Babesia caballi TaxID=5871 RepID=A0AAV4M1D6_BABCB|nr:methyl-accepting chemotaxis sensory transducer, putative [Babesia caballi]
MLAGAVPGAQHSGHSRAQVHSRLMQNVRRRFQQMKSPENGHSNESSADIPGRSDNIATMHQLGDEHGAESAKHGTAPDPSTEKPAERANPEDKKESAIDALSRREAINDMHGLADKMRAAAKQMNEEAKTQAAASKGQTTETDVGSASVPKDSAGNIIITNKTHETPQKAKEEDDPIKALKIATENLYERARHKNLPVGEPGELATPQQIYQALNRLEYIVDGYRHSQLESPNPDLNISEDTAESGEDPSEAAVAREESGEGEASTDGDRFLQVASRAAQRKAKGEDEDEDEDGDEEGEEVDEEGSAEGDEDGKAEGDEDDKAEGDDDGTADDMDEESNNDDKSGQRKKSSDNGQKKMTAEEAVETLRKTITELVETLDSVVAAQTGVQNVLIPHHTNVQQVR